MSGEAKECVAGFLSQCTSDSYKAALKLLKERFGSDFIVANAFRQQMRRWPKINPDDNVALRKFSDFLRHVNTAKLTNKSLSCLDDEQENRSLLYKLPDWLHRRWARKVSESYHEGGPYPNFKKFVDFICIEADVVNNPITNLSKSTSVKTKVSHSTVATPPTPKSLSCFVCSGSHVIEKCEKFLEKSYEDRVQYIRQEHLCFRCLRKGHQSRFCKKRVSCEKCQRNHLTVLHNNNAPADSPKQDSATSNASSVSLTC